MGWGGPPHVKIGENTTYHGGNYRVFLHDQGVFLNQQQFSNWTAYFCDKGSIGKLHFKTKQRPNARVTLIKGVLQKRQKWPEIRVCLKLGTLP